MPTDRRIARFEQVLSQRLGHVRCAAEAIYHRHNVSAILRSADAMGVQHAHLVEGGFQPSKGAARGSERWLSLHWHRSVSGAVEAIQGAGYAIWVADLADDSVAPEAVPLDRPVCLWFGNELLGVSPEARAAADGVVTIPQHGMAQSLNVSVAAALTLRAVCERARAELGTAALLDPTERNQITTRWVEREQRRKRSQP